MVFLEGRLPGRNQTAFFKKRLPGRNQIASKEN